MAEPFATAAVHEAVALVLPRTRITFVGALGMALMVIEVEAVDEGEVPTALVAVTVKV